MKMLREWLEPLIAQVRAHPGIATGLLFLGWFVALLMAGTTAENRNFLLSVVTAVGTLSAAGAAFWAASASAQSAALTQKALEHQVNRDLQANQPLLIATSALAKRLLIHRIQPWGTDTPYFYVAFKVSITLTNMCAFPIYVWKFDVSPEPRRRSWNSGNYYGPIPAGYLIPPGQSFTHTTKFNVQVDLPGTTKTVFFYNFQCSSTGHRRHYLPVPAFISARFEDDTYPMALCVQLGHPSRERGKDRPPQDWEAYGKGPQEYAYYLGSPSVEAFSELDGKTYEEYWNEAKQG
jgi:hypothetical protein